MRGVRSPRVAPDGAESPLQPSATVLDDGVSMETYRALQAENEKLLGEVQRLREQAEARPAAPTDATTEAAAGQEVGSKAKPLPRLGVLRLDYGQCVGGLGEESALVRVRVCARAFSPDRSRPPLPALPRLPTATWRCRQPPIVRVPCSFQSGAWPHFRHGSRRKHTGPGGSHTRSSDEGKGGRRAGEGRGGRLGTSCCFPQSHTPRHPNS